MKKRAEQTTKHKLVALASCFVVALIFSNASQAQTNNQEIINQQDWITRNQQNQIEEQRRIKEQETIRKERARKKKEAEEGKEQQIPISGKTAECFPIKTIALADAKSISKRQQKKLTSPFIGKCIEFD